MGVRNRDTEHEGAPLSAAPIFVVGFPRSGTTLLQALIGAHPRVAAPPEVDFIRRIYGHADYFGDLSRDGAIERAVAATIDYLPLSEAGFDPQRIAARVPTDDPTLAAVFDATMQDFAQRNGKVRWSEKTPLQRAEDVWALFPDAQVVHIVREPMATIASTWAMLSMFPSPSAAARAWRAFTRDTLRAGAQQGSARYTRVSYERLTEAPAAVMASVFAFLGEDFDPAILDDADRRKTTVPQNFGPWMGRVLEPITTAPTEHVESLTPGERARVAAIVGPLATELGYRVDERPGLGHRVANALGRPLDTGKIRWKDRAALRARTPEQRYEVMVSSVAQFFAETHGRVNRADGRGPRRRGRRRLRLPG